MLLRRAETSDSLKSAKIVEKWLEERLPTLPSHIKVEAYDEAWKLINERIMLLIATAAANLSGRNGLFLFLNASLSGLQWGFPSRSWRHWESCTSRAAASIW